MGDPSSRVLAIMGSGETSPTMVTIHKELIGRLGLGQGQGGAAVKDQYRAILLDTPYAFQENAADISARAQSYFARSVGLTVDVVSDADLPESANPDAAADIAAIRSSDWVFAGPGSPSYLLRRWSGGPVADALRERIAAGSGLTVIASAAAAAIGFVAIPVYEIYKVGADPYWLDGLDLFGALGLKVAMIPHYDNAEGGTHDTRFCYLGERRLSLLERELPDDAAVLGVDEHTALVLDLATQEAQVLGRGGATVRKAGVSTVLPAGSRVSLDDLRGMVRSGAPAPSPGRDDAGPGASGPAAAGQQDQTVPGQRKPVTAQAELPEITREAEYRFDTAERARDSAAMVSAILDLEAGIHAWSTDTDENDNADRARIVLRGLISRLGRAAEQGLADPADQLKPAIEPLISLRDTLRKDGGYAAADTIRDALTASGIEVHDSPEGTAWTVRSSAPVTS